MKVDIHQLLPDIIPTVSKPVWEFDNFLSNDFRKSGIYVFWDKDSYEGNKYKDYLKANDNEKDDNHLCSNNGDQNKNHLEYQSVPLYIGKAIRTGDKGSSYGIGKRIYDHFHKQDIYTMYTYYIDLYIFDDILEGKIDDPVKSMSYYYWGDDKDTKDSFPFERLPLSAYYKDRCELNAEALTDIYEPYLIARRQPYFNINNNYYSGMSKKARLENAKRYPITFPNHHWKYWHLKLNVPEQKLYEVNILDKFFEKPKKTKRPKKSTGHTRPAKPTKPKWNK
ncbi:hypothetical protein [Bacillus cereus]|uniref:hypothetical protein n=1 Tax=Bacillus cereus TaxID=1396 RepID=UPI0039785754